MKLRALAFAAVLLLAACSKLSQENFAKIQNGMTEQEVAAILGKPTETSSTGVGNLSATTSRWADKEASITIRFLNGKVMLKDYEKGAAKK
jgi:hypothetical protein